jgi:TolB-like protein/DNA-binding winged helix-turn-helix (wHTH) protein
MTRPASPARPQERRTFNEGLAVSARISHLAMSTRVSSLPIPDASGAGDVGCLQIGDWCFDARGNELRSAAQVVRLELKAAQVLACLAARPAEVVTRDELLAQVWPGVVVGDDAVTQVVIKLRRALGDDSREPRYIETIPKRGYRLLATVRPGPDPQGGAASAALLPAAAGPASSTAAPPAAPPPAAVRPPAPLPGPPRWRRPAPVLAAALALLMLAAAWIWHGELEPRAAAPAAREAEQSYPLVAILPLANLSGDPARDYLSDGISADLIDALGRFSGLRVLSWTAVQGFKGQSPVPRGVAEQFAARYVVSGSVRESAGTLRVAIELADARSGVQLWSQHHDVHGAQLFDMVDRIVAQVVATLAVQLTDAEQQRAAHLPAESAEAYDLVLRARALLQLDQRAANLEARRLLARAQQLAPEFAQAWVYAGEAEWRRATFGWVEDPAAAAQRAAELARKALELPDLRSHVQAHSLLAAVATNTGDPEDALRHTARAMALNPSDTGSLFRHAYALLTVGRVDEAIVAYETVMRDEVRPTLGPRTQLAWAYYVAGRYEQAVSYAEAAIARSPDVYSFHVTRAAALAQLGRLAEARSSLETARHLNPLLSAEDAGTRLRNPEHAAKVREGLAKAGL